MEFHHYEPWGMGGEQSVDNIALLCRGHNRLLAEDTYGETAMTGYRPGGEAPRLHSTMQRTSRTTVPKRPSSPGSTTKTEAQNTQWHNKSNSPGG